MEMYRKAGKIKRLQKRILILCEGETERIYLDALKNTLSRDIQRNIEINIKKAKCSEPANIIKEALTKRKTAKHEMQPYDSIWLVFDDDNRSNIETLFAKAKKENFSIAYNSISIELWFILHFEQTAKAFNSASEAETHLKKYCKQYSKTNTTIFEMLRPFYQSQALSNAAWLRSQKNIKNPDEAWKAKSITTMDLITETLLKWEMIGK
jgi:hypothetical protein